MLTWNEDEFDTLADDPERPENPDWQAACDYAAADHEECVSRPPQPDPPRWIDGEPANLEAAAEDALEWLQIAKRFDLIEWTRHCGARDHVENRARFKACLAALEAHLPNRQGKEEDAP